MTGLEIATLVLGIVKEVVGIVSDLITKGVTGKKPEEVQASLKGLVDRHMEKWIPQVVKPADDLFNTPGTP